MPSMSTTGTSSSSSSSSPSSSTRRRCFRTTITPTSNSNNSSSNNTSRSSLFKSNKEQKKNTNNSIVSTGSSSRFPLLVSPSSSNNNSHDDYVIANSRNSNSSRGNQVSPAPSAPPKPPVTTTSSSSTSPRSVASLVTFYSSPTSTTTTSVKKSSSPTTTTATTKSRNNNNNNNNNTGNDRRLVYQSTNNNNSSGMIHALHAAQTHSSLELTTVAKDDYANTAAGDTTTSRLLSCGGGSSTASCDSFILPLDNASFLDDNGFFLAQGQPQQEVESSALLHAWNESFEDPYLLQKEEVRLRNKNNKQNKRQEKDERDYFCLGSKSTTTTTTQQQPRSTVDTECSTTAAASANNAHSTDGDDGVAVRYLHQGRQQDANNIIDSPPPVSCLHGVPPRKYFDETDQLSVPSQNEEHGGDVDFYHHVGQDEVEVLHVVAKQQQEEQDKKSKKNNVFAASLASIEVDDQQGILVSNSLSCHVATLQKTRAAQHAHDLYYWNTRLTARIMTHGQLHFTTAEAWLELGQAHFEAKEYHAAFRAFSCAQRIIKSRYANHRPVALARALDRMGVACSKTARHVDNDHDDSSFSRNGNGSCLTPEQTFQKAMELLLEALRIRHHELGPWHVDTVDCLNHLAWVQCDAGLYDTARRSFWEVFFVRKAIFGSCHPSVAVAAHDLANCFFKLSQLDNADNFYSIALEIYDAMNVPIQNPAVARLLRDMKRLERLQKTF